MQNNKKQSGFTLVELSIVIVIIGLIVAGVVGGQALVEQAKLRQVVTQMNKIKIATNAFRLEYGTIPGDLSNAADYWGQAANCYADTTGSTNTCNGDGNKHLAYVHTLDNSGVRYEPWHFWKHLENAKLFEGTFTGYSNNTQCTQNNFCMQPGINVPKGPFNGSGWLAFSVKTFNTGPKYLWQGRITNRDRNILVFTNPSASGANGTWHSRAVVLTPKNQFSIDSKIDDGFPYKGAIVDMSGTSASYSPNCATVSSNEFGNNPPGSTSVDSPYNLSYQDVACMMFVDLE